MDDPDGLIEADTHSKGFSKVLLSILGHKGGVAFNERGWEMGEPILGYKEGDGGWIGVRWGRLGGFGSLKAAGRGIKDHYFVYICLILFWIS